LIWIKEATELNDRTPGFAGGTGKFKETEVRQPLERLQADVGGIGKMKLKLPYSLEMRPGASNELLATMM
jgi:hypothetical protein